jgi:hypothetical protein
VARTHGPRICDDAHIQAAGQVPVLAPQALAPDEKKLANSSTCVRALRTSPSRDSGLAQASQSSDAEAGGNPEASATSTTATLEPRMTQTSNDSLHEVKIFAREDTIWGIPSKLFIGSAVLTVAMLTQIPKIFALAMGGLMFGVLFAIYNDDPRALQAWQRSMGRPVRWSLCPRKPRKVTFLPFKD